MDNIYAYTIGIFAFVKTKSKASLIGSTAIAIPFFYGGYLIQNNSDAGHYISLSTSVALAYVGMSRWSATKKPMPSLLLFGLGLLSVAYHGTKVKEILGY